MAAGESFLVVYNNNGWTIHKKLEDREEAIRSSQMLAKELHQEVLVFRRIGAASVTSSVEFKLG